MNAVEKLEAAITKLEAVKARGSDGPWRACHPLGGGVGKVAISNDVGRYVAHYVDEYDAERIVTLHRTIDAQLAILRGGLEFTRRNPHLHDADIDALATAILGGDS